uniref:Uncharacterized protein n=1 Tax=Syphacia muris TaxID=451379 RepID=A0A0N5AI69_9BILA
MPFIGKDWRGPGNEWIRCPHTDGWEQRKLRPTQIADFEVPQSISCSLTASRFNRTESLTSLSYSDAASLHSEETTDDSGKLSHSLLPQTITFFYLVQLSYISTSFMSMS